MKTLNRNTAFFIIFMLSWAFVPKSFAQQLSENKSNTSNSSFFIENKGQWDPEVRFLARLNNMNVWITESGVVYDFFAVEKNAALQNDVFPQDKFKMPDTNSKIHGHVIKMTFPEIKKKKFFSANGKLTAYYNYFLGNNSDKWTGTVSLFKEVYVKEVYSGVDARFYFEADLFRYDLIVNPRADISLFRLKFEGQSGISVNQNAELVLKTSIGDMLNSNLFAYQETNKQNKPVSCKFVNADLGLIGFDLGKYDHNIQLIIDPLVYSTYLGGNTSDQLNTIVVDKNRNAFVAGQSNSSNYPTTVGAYETVLGFHQNGIITKLDAGGFPDYSTFIGDSTLIVDIAIDTNGNVYATGWTMSHAYPVTPGAFQIIDKEPGAGGAEGFVTKLNSAGSSLIYSTFLGGTGYDFPSSITLNKQENAFITGTTYSNDFPLSNGALQIFKSGLNDCFITKLDKNGKGIVYSTYLGGKSVDVANDIAIDSIGDAYIVGRTQSSDLYTTVGTFQPDSVATSVNGFLAKLNRFGTNLIYSTFFAGKGGTGLSNNITGVAIDTAGYAYITGYTNSDSFPVTAGAYQTSMPSLGRTHAFVSKFDKQAATLVYSTYFGGNSDDYASNIEVDMLGNALIGVTSLSSNLPYTTDGVQQLNRGNRDLFVTMFNPTASAIFYGSYYGGSKDDNMFKIFYDGVSNIYLTGQAVSDDFPTSPSAFQQIKGSPCGTTCYGDGFATRINIDPPTILTNPISGFPTCAGTYISVPYSVRSLFDTANKFSLQLSGISGSFSSPLTLRTIKANGSGTITAQLPVNLKYSTKYRLRVIGSNPASIGTDNGSDLTIDSATIRSFTISDTLGCLNNNSFVYSFDTNYLSQITRYHWSFGDGDTSNLLMPQHTYKTADTFIVSLELTNSLNCIDTLTQRVIVFPVPKASFDMVDSMQCLLGNKFDFINNSTIKSGTYSEIWYFGDGNTSVLFDTSHSYSITDTFNVKLLIISDWTCKDSVLKKAYIAPSPKANFTINDSSQCLNGNNFSFSNLTLNQGAKNIKYNWTFGDATSDTLANPIHVYLSDSVYSVQLKSISDIGCGDSLVKMIVVSPHPKSGFSINDTNQCISGNSFVFTNLTNYKKLGSGTYLWKFGNGNTDTTKNPVYAYPSNGTFTVQLNVVSDMGCKDSAIHQLIVTPKPKADFLVNDTDQCLAGNSFVFTNLTTNISSGMASYLWRFGDGNSDTTSNSTYSYAIADTFNVELVSVSDVNCRDSITKKLIVYSMPLADFSINTNPQIFPGNKFIFTNLSNTFNQGLSSWLWDFGDGDTSTLTDAVHSYKSVSSFFVTLYATTGKACKDTITKKVWLTNPLMNADFTTSTVCLGDSAVFTNISTIKNDSFLNFLWNFGDSLGTIVKNDPRHLYKDTGIYQVTMIALTVSGLTDTAIHTIQVLPSANLSITYSPSTLLEKGTVATLTAVGTFDSIFWSTAEQTASIKVDSTNLYSVRVVDKNGCNASDSIYLLFYEKQKFNSMTVITPNGDGINDLWKIFDIEKYQPCKLIIYNRWGDELYSTSNYQNNWDGKYKGKYLPSGSYYFVIEAWDGKFYKGVINICN